MTLIADRLYRDCVLMIGESSGLGVLMWRGPECFRLVDRSWVLIPWLPDRFMNQDLADGLREIAVPSPEDFFRYPGNRIVEVVELSDSYLVAGAFAGRYLKDMSGAWRYTGILDSFWTLGGKVHGVFAGNTVGLSGLGLIDRPATAQIEGHGAAPVAIVPDARIDVNMDLLIGLCADGYHAVWQMSDDCTVCLVRYSFHGRVVPTDSLPPEDGNSLHLYEIVGRANTELFGHAVMVEADGRVLVFVAVDFLGGYETDDWVTQVCIFEPDGAVFEGRVTGFPATYFGDRIAVLRNRVFAAHDRTVFELDLQLLHFSPIGQVLSEVVAVRNVDDQLICFTMTDVKQLPVPVVIDLPNKA